jgi:hypothetical protein
MLSYRTAVIQSIVKKKKSYKKKQWRPPSTKKRKKGGKNLSPRNRNACHSTSTALLKIDI